MDLKKSDVIIDGGLVVKKKKTDRRSKYLYALVLAVVAAMPLSAFAQGSIFGTVQNTDLSTPANGDISFVGFLDDTDEEIRIESSTGAGYDAGNWFDDFQNYLTEAPGNPYDYYFYNLANDEGFHLGKAIPNNSFQQENIQLAAVAWPFKPTGLTGMAVSTSSVVIGWNSSPGMTYHVYRRVATSSGSFFRVDDPTGSLANAGVSDSFFVDVTVDGVSSYNYLIVAEDGSGNYSQHSDVATVNSSVVAAPVVVAINPDSGLTLGGTVVTITGSGFDMAGAGALVGAASLTGVTVVSPYEITGTTQAGTAGLADVSVTNLASGQLSNILVGGYNYISNSLPILAAIGPQNVTEGQLLAFTATATDADGGFPVMTSSALPAGATYVDNGDGSGSFDWTPGFFDDGVYNVTFYATDDLQPSLIDSEQVVITVIEAGNQLPVLAAIGPQVGTENSLLTFAVSATDIESTPVMTTSTLPSGASYVDNGDGSGDFNWTPGFTDAGTYNVTFYATDDSAAVDSEQVVITINEVGNQSPVLAAIGAQSTTENVNLNFGINASDPDATIPSLTTSTLPTGATFVDNGDGSGTFDWTPGFTDAGAYNVTFYASDGPAVDSEAVVITVNEAGNQSPVLAAIGAQSTTEDVNLNFGITATDPDATIPSLTTSTLPTGATFVDNGDGSGTFDWTPSFTDAGTYNVTFYAGDGSAADSEAVVITVNESGNQSPILAAIGAQSTTENVNLNFGISASDPDATIPSLTTSTLPTGATFVDNGDGSGTFDWTPSFTDAGTYDVTFYADDGTASDSEGVVITVNEAGNQSPVLAAIGAQSTTEDVNLNFGINASDPDATIPSLTTSTLPTGATFVDNGDGSGTFDWTPGFTDAGAYNVTFYADDGTASDSEAVVITVNEAGNQSPILAAIGAQSTTEDVNLNFGINASDPDATIPSLTTSTLPTGATFVDNGDGSGTFDWTPGFTDAGAYNVTFYADDGTAADSEAVVITVNEAGNQDPVLAAIGPQGTNEDVNLNFVVTATDPDATTPALSTSALPTGATFVDNLDGTGTFDWTPGFTDAGIYNVTFYASDGPAADSEAVVITIAESGNQSPVLAAIGAQSTTENVNLNFGVTATDPDATIPTLSTSTLPTGATFVDNLDGSGTFDWTPSFIDAGSYNVTFYADDGALIDSEQVVITVNEAGNQSPVLAAIGPQLTVEDVLLNFIVTATDPDADIPTLTTSTLPTGASFVDNGDGSGSFDWLPGFTDAGTYNVTFYADDGALIDSEQVVIDVLDAENQIPVLALIGPQTIDENVNLNFTVSATDPDATIPALSISTPPTGATFVDNGDGSGVFDWTPDFTQAGIHNITFYANDGLLVDSEIVVITVNEVGNQPPVLAPIGPQTITEGANLNFVVTSSDPDGTIPLMTNSILPAGATYTDNADGTGTFDWTPDFTQAGAYNVTFYADDGLVADSEAVTITVNDAGNQIPTLNAIGPQTVVEGLNLNFIVSATDPDTDIPLLSTSTLPTGATFVDNGDGTAVFDWTPDFTQANAYNVTFYADDGALIDSEQVVITVTESGNHDPVLDSIRARVAFEGINLNFLVTASDSDGTIPALSAVSLPTGATFVDNLDGTGNFDWTPDFLSAGVYNVMFYADDGVALPDSELVQITVSESGDQPPVITAIPDTSVAEGDILELVITASDPEGGFVSIAASTLMNHVTFVDSGNGVAVLTYAPDYFDAGEDSVLIFASEVAPPYQASSQTFVVTTLEANQPPLFDSIGPFTVAVEDSLTFLVTVTDTTDADTAGIVLMTMLVSPPNATFVDNGDNTGRFIFHPDHGMEGLDTATFLAVDQGTPQLSTTMDVEITVVGTNIPPVLDSIGPQAVTEGNTLVINVSASDPDGGLPIFLSVDSLIDNAAFIDNLDNTGLFTFSPTFLQAGLYSVTFMADDGVDVTEELVLIQVVEAGNQAPVFDPLPSPSVTEGTTLVDSITAQDPELELITYSIDSLTMPSNFTFTDSGNGVAWFGFAPDFVQAGIYDITLFAHDGADSTAAVLTVDVVEAGNQFPSLSPLSNVTVDELNTVSFLVGAADIDGPPPIMTTSALPGTATFEDPDADNIYVFEWTTTQEDSGSYSVWFYATDADFPSDIDSAEVIITVVDVNRTPWFLIPFNQPDSVMELDTLLFTFMAWD
ncbi:MAG: putative Ig domain-containing protein, partial [candidate division Zixibacteria bacterium]|nr:putative Ig domain-containing protein [candidate division Zixibacteria bacterium]